MPPTATILSQYWHLNYNNVLFMLYHYNFFIISAIGVTFLKDKLLSSGMSCLKNAICGTMLIQK